MTGAHSASVIHRSAARNGFKILAFFCHLQMILYWENIPGKPFARRYASFLSVSLST
jgi:hypothetical protein